MQGFKAAPFQQSVSDIECATYLEPMSRSPDRPLTASPIVVNAVSSVELYLIDPGARPPHLPTVRVLPHG